ncbi:similar to Saccharomyces cerevisiae YMR284W YKU70 Subunit of the telomeric Ku complex (Yku70p-Yku80p) [Geotrichum candidum]|uniref:ATP-dependent DNA helicase II subunit 1 n=1 Tax=Geotrichum candidum TaxID=1173061 RepID=A0A0J9XI50_GEOCN|nr:similar to Saccharomyces cerevisiae YMR284W YKU70 Subunit of the telomeric Ku complex (Yku70p-Yku80p) [Geotrichum candidum]
MENKSWDLDIGQLDTPDSVYDYEFLDHKDALLYVIEVDSYMLKSSNEITPLEIVLQTVYEAIIDRVMSSPTDACGILLFGLEGKTESGMEGCKVLLDLAIPTVDGLRQIKELIKDIASLKVNTTNTNSASIANVLFLANQQFSQSPTKYFSRRILFITSNDRPNIDKPSKTAAITRAKDLGDIGISFIPYFLSGESKFDPSLFYEDLFYAIPSIRWDDGVSEMNTVDGLGELKNAISALKAIKRALFTNYIELTPGVKIGVKGYKIYSKTMPVKTTQACRVGNQYRFVERKSINVGVDTGKTLEPQEIRKTFKFGPNYLQFLPEQISEIRSIGDPIIKLIGFKPSSSVEWMYNVNSSYFLYPTEDNFVGSVRSFTSLVKSLWKTNKVAIVWAIFRRNSSGRMGALIPSVSENEPQGLHFVSLPFSDDIRDVPPFEANNKPPQELINPLTSIVRKLTMPNGYQSERYPNPLLMWFNRVIQAAALDELPMAVDDKTLPKFKSINTRAGHFIEEWNLNLDSVETKTTLKRTSEESQMNSNNESKHRKLDDPDQIKLLYETGKLNKLTVAVLSSFLNGNGISTSNLRKPQLIEAVNDFFANQK